MFLLCLDLALFGLLDLILQHKLPDMGAVGAVKRVAVIGAGPAGAITIDSLAKEKAFDAIRVFERREAPGGCW